MNDSLPIVPLDSLRGQHELARAREAAGRGDTEAAARKFEALLATQIVKELRRGTSEGFFGAGAGSDVYDGWFDEHLGQALAQSGTLDLAATVRVSLAQKQNGKEQS